ncbi:arginine ABC transporter ATPase [Escherichia coli]|nr:arginine ABC transporter ATPase [Escherichia coli]
MSIQLNGINCFYGEKKALGEITLEGPQGERLVGGGPRGEGKRALLRVLKGRERPS